MGTKGRSLAPVGRAWAVLALACSGSAALCLARGAGWGILLLLGVLGAMWSFWAYYFARFLAASATGVTGVSLRASLLRTLLGAALTMMHTVAFTWLAAQRHTIAHKAIWLTFPTVGLLCFLTVVAWAYTLRGAEIRSIGRGS